MADGPSRAVAVGSRLHHRSRDGGGRARASLEMRIAFLRNLETMFQMLSFTRGQEGQPTSQHSTASIIRRKAVKWLAARRPSFHCHFRASSLPKLILLCPRWGLSLSLSLSPWSIWTLVLRGDSCATTMARATTSLLDSPPRGVICSNEWPFEHPSRGRTSIPSSLLF